MISHGIDEFVANIIESHAKINLPSLPTTITTSTTIATITTAAASSSIAGNRSPTRVVSKRMLENLQKQNNRRAVAIFLHEKH
jgi:hypothetical protein